MKSLYAVVFVLFSFAAPAQTLETWIAAYHLDELDCFGETTQQSTMPPQIIGIELLCAAILNDADGVATTGSNGAENVPVGAIQPSDKNSTVEYSTRSDDKVVVGDTIKQIAMPTQIVATTPSIETPSEAKFDEADEVAITGANGAEDVSVGVIRHGDENPIVAYSSRSDDQPTVGDPIK